MGELCEGGEGHHLFDDLLCPLGRSRVRIQLEIKIPLDLYDKDQAPMIDKTLQNICTFHLDINI